MKEFDTQKGAFYLVAIVIMTQMAVVLVVVLGCVGGIVFKALPAGSCKDTMDPLIELFQMSFTAAIAFAGGRMTAPKATEIKLPEKEESPK